MRGRVCLLVLRKKQAVDAVFLNVLEEYDTISPPLLSVAVSQLVSPTPYTVAFSGKVSAAFSILAENWL